jgi:hypothetical protein
MNIYDMNETLLRLVNCLLRERALDDEWNEYLPYRETVLELAEHGTLDEETARMLKGLAEHWCRPRNEY